MAKISILMKKGSALNTTILIFVMKREEKWMGSLMLCSKVIEMCGINSIKMGSKVNNCALFASLVKFLEVLLRKEIKMTRSSIDFASLAL